MNRSRQVERRPAQRAMLAAAMVLPWLALALPAAHAVTERRHVAPRTGMLEVPLDELVVAVRHKDRAEIGRVAERIGPARLAEALRRADAQGVQAALTGIVMLPGRARLIGPVTELLSVSDATVVAAAARALGEILAPATIADLDDWDVPADLITTACGTLRATALLPANATLARLAALEAMGDALTVCRPQDLSTLLKDPTPSIRRAAALVMRPQQRLATGGFAQGTRDVDPGVASASVAALCEAMAEPAAWPKGGGREPIWEQTRQLARRMAVAPATPTDDAVEMLDCLDPSLASDHQILDGMRAHKKTPLGERAAAILAAPASVAHPSPRTTP